MIAAELTQQVLQDNHLQDCRLVASIPAIELHRLIIGINALFLVDISLTVAGDQIVARGNTLRSWCSDSGDGKLYSRSFARHEFALKDV